MIRLAKRDFELLDRIDRLAQEGHSLDEIARKVGYSGHKALRYRLSRLGFDAPSAPMLRTILGGRRWRDLVAAGEVVPEDDEREAA